MNKTDYYVLTGLPCTEHFWCVTPFHCNFTQMFSGAHHVRVFFFQWPYFVVAWENLKSRWNKIRTNLRSNRDRYREKEKENTEKERKRKRVKNTKKIKISLFFWWTFCFRIEICLLNFGYGVFLFGKSLMWVNDLLWNEISLTFIDWTNHESLFEIMKPHAFQKSIF